MSNIIQVFLHIQFDMKITGAETWQGPRLRSKTGIISTSPPAHFSLQNSLQFNNVTLHSARVNSSKFQGEKVFILNNHAHFSPSFPASRRMLMPLKVQMCIFLPSYNIQCISNLALFPLNEKHRFFIFHFTSCLL